MKKLSILFILALSVAFGYGQSTHVYPTLQSGHILVGGTGTLAVDTPFYNSLLFMQQVNQWVAAQGDTAVSFVANYKWNTIDSVPFYYTTSGSGVENGGWLTTQLTGGDSVKLNTPIGVVIGASLVAGHPWRNGRLEGVNLAFQDSLGQITYYLSQYSHFQWMNAGIGGQGTVACRPRFMRDGIGQIATVNDTRGSQTLTHKASVIIIFADLALNDIYNNVPLATIEQNFLWMAEQCMENNIPCIMTNCIGESGSTQAQLLAISQFNKWLASGIMNQYQVPIFDINSIWNSGTLGGVSTTGNDNYHFSSLVNSGDGVHFTQAGYDSVAQWLIRTMRLPVLTKIAITTALSPTTPIANYNRPTNITFSGQQTGTIAGVPTPFTMPNNAFDTLTLTGTSVIVDTAWARIITTTNVTGTSTQTGFSTISFLLTNNPTGQIWYAPPSFNGATIGNQISTSLNLRNDRYQSNINLLDIQNTDGSDIFKVVSQTVGNTNVIINDITNLGALSGAIVTIRAPAITALNTNGSIVATGTNNQLGQIQMGGTTAATGTGFGIMLVGSALMLNSASSANLPTTARTGLYRFEPYTALNFTSSSSNLNIATLESTQIYGNSAGSTDTLGGWNLFQTESDTVTAKLAGAYNGIAIYHNPINLGVQQLYGFRNNYGYNFLNWSGGSTSIGDSSVIQMHGSAELAINSTLKGFLPPSMTTTQRNAIGYVKSITVNSVGSGYGTIPKVVFSGGGGSGVRGAAVTSAGTVTAIQLLDKGSGYGGGSTPTLTLANTTGSGATFTVNMSGADSGLVIFNTTLDSLQYYNGTAWIDIGGSGGSTPTLQQVITAGNTLTVPETINNGTHLLTFSGAIQLNGLYLNGSYHSANYTLSYTGTDDIVYMNPTGGSTDTVFLPAVAGSTPAPIWTIYNQGTGTVVIDGGSGNTFGFGGSNRYYYLEGQDQSVSIIAAGSTAWGIMAMTDQIKNIKYSHTIFTPTTGQTVTSVLGQENIINPAGTLATLTIALPSSPKNGDAVWFTATQAITTITYSGGTVVGAPTTISLGGQWRITFDTGNSTWY